MLEGSPGCSHREEAPRDQPWRWRCSSFGQGKGQTAGKGLQEMLSAVSWHSAGRCPSPAGSGHLLSSSSSRPWRADHHQLSPGGAGEAGTRLPARGEAEGCDTRVGRSTANHLGQRLLPFPGPGTPRRANKTLSAHPALPGVDGFRSHRQEDRQEGWGELAALQEPARMEIMKAIHGHPRQGKAAGSWAPRVARGCGARRKPPAPARLLWSTSGATGCHLLVPVLPARGKSPS